MVIDWIEPIGLALVVFLVLYWLFEDDMDGFA